MNNIDTSMLTLVAVAVVGLLVIVSLFRKPKTNDAALESEISGLKQAIDRKDGELREAWKNADKFEALAGERKEEIDRLNGDLSKLRVKLEGEADEQQKLSNTISRMEAEMKAEREASDEKIQMLSKIRDDMEAKFKDLLNHEIAKEMYEES